MVHSQHCCSTRVRSRINWYWLDFWHVRHFGRLSAVWTVPRFDFPHGCCQKMCWTEVSLFGHYWRSILLVVATVVCSLDWGCWTDRLSSSHLWLHSFLFSSYFPFTVVTLPFIGFVSIVEDALVSFNFIGIVAGQTDFALLFSAWWPLNWSVQCEHKSWRFWTCRKADV